MPSDGSEKEGGMMKEKSFLSPLVHGVAVRFGLGSTKTCERTGHYGSRLPDIVFCKSRKPKFLNR